MLGSTSLQNWYASADSIQIKPRVICEWNANALSQPYIYGHGDDSFSELTDIPSSTKTSGTIQGSFKYSMSFSPTISAASTKYSTTQTISSPTAGSAFRLSFIATADKIFSLTVTATAKTSAGVVIDDNTLNINLGPSTTKPFVIDSFSYIESDKIDVIEYSFYGMNEDYASSVSVTIDSPRVYRLNYRELAVTQYFSVSDVFKINRPGDAYTQGSDAIAKIGNENVSPYNMAWNGIFNYSEPKKLRNFLPAENAAFKYYFYEHSSGSTDTIFAKYLNESKVNKIILKANAVRSLPTSVSISTLNAAGSWSSPVSIASPFDSNGLAQIYWSGSTWTKTTWTYVPTYSDQVISLSTSIYGIKVTFTNPTSDGEVHLVEISPRLELDISSYVTGLSITQELSNDSLPTPIGVSNSNTANITLENLPVYNGSAYVQPFDNYNSPLAGLLKKNVDVRILVTPFGQDASREEVQVAKMVTASWINDGIESCSIELYDAIKTLLSVPAPSIYKTGASVQSIIADILDTVGFSDYNYASLISSTYLKTIIPHYWTVTNKGISVMEVLQNLLLPYQISMYVDQYGIINFKHISEVIGATASSTYKVTSNNSGSIKANIVEFNINDENSPSKVSVEYTNIIPASLTSVNDGTRKAERPAIFTPESKVVGYLRLAKPLSKEDRSMTVVYDDESSSPSYIESYSGYLLINSEIVYFDGIEKKFILTSNTTSQIVTRVVKDVKENDAIVYQYTAMGYTVTQPLDTKTRVLRNLVRGCFGSPIQDHAAGSSSTSEFTTSPSSGALSPGYDNLIMNKVNSICLYNNSTCEAEHKIFSGTFVIPPTTQIPSNGTEVIFGLHLNSSSTTNQNAIKVGIRIYRKNKDKGSNVYTAGLIVTQYGNSSQVIKENKYDLQSFETDENGNPIKASNLDQDIINVTGTNEIVALFSPDSSTDNKKMAVMINGYILTLADSTETIKISSNKISFSLPCLVLESSPNFAGKKVGAFNNGVAPINLNNLQAFKIKGEKDQDSTLNILASVLNGNLLGLSNKDELESVVKERKVNPVTTAIGFTSKSVAREIILIDAAFSNFPALYSFPVRSGYVYYNRVKEDNKTVLKSEYIVPDSLTFSSIIHTPISARFAVINSYTSPVFLNAENRQVTSASRNTTTLNGEILRRDSKSTLSEIINSDNSDSNVTISSDWIQNANAANEIIKYISQAALMKKNSIDVTVFGNPLITVGDVFDVDHTYKNFSGKYAVVSVNHDFNNGLVTSLSMRRVQP